MVTRPPAAASPRRQRGMSLMELMTVMVVSVILAATAAPAFTGAIKRTRVKSAATDLQLAMKRARSEASHLNNSVTIAPVGGYWENGWTVTDSAGHVVVKHEATKEVVFTTTVASIIYQRSGRVKAASAPSFTVAAKNDNLVSRCVSADLTGRPHIKEGAC
jgi:type IV fimbrial biogenesis protein FimT